MESYATVFIDCRYLVPADLTVGGQFVYVVRKRIKLGPDKAIFIFVKSLLPPTGESKNIICTLGMWFYHSLCIIFISSFFWF